MSATEASRLIDELGGTSAVARLCRVRSQAVSQWRLAGIPPARLQVLQLLRPDLFDEGEPGQIKLPATAEREA